MDINIPDIYNLDHLGKSIESTQITLTFTYNSSMNHIEIIFDTITGKKIEYITDFTCESMVDGKKCLTYKYTYMSPFYANIYDYTGWYINDIITYSTEKLPYASKKIYKEFLSNNDQNNINLIDKQPITIYFSNIVNITFTRIIQMNAQLHQFIFQSCYYQEIHPIYIFSNEIIQPLLYADLDRMTFIKTNAYQMKFRGCILKFKIYKYHMMIFIYLASIIIDEKTFDVVTYKEKKFNYTIKFCQDIFYTNEVIDFKKIIGVSYKYGISYSLEN
jgi:hypothetical protein